MKALTTRQREVLDFISGALDTRNQSPSLREIAAHFGFRGMKAAADHVTALKRKGALCGTDRQARSLKPSDSLASLRRRLVHVPLFGSISAGFAEERRQEAEGCVSVDVESTGIRPTARTFALRVRGDSMIGRHIVEGDVVILEHGMTPRPGQVVAALIDNENTLKTYSIHRGKPVLKAENPRYPDLIPADELVIQGVMIALIRKTPEGRV
ncbi:MAG: repressor LexA [Verrucomicrobia bacterium]|nr:repressor LexA [Verrucomicrobiota bacterium]